MIGTDGSRLFEWVVRQEGSIKGREKLSGILRNVYYQTRCKMWSLHRKEKKVKA